MNFQRRQQPFIFRHMTKIITGIFIFILLTILVQVGAAGYIAYKAFDLDWSHGIKPVIEQVWGAPL